MNCSCKLQLMNGRIGKYSYKEHTDASQAVTHVAGDSGALSRTEERGAFLMVDNAVLHEKMQAELDRKGYAGDKADQLVREMNVLASILIRAAEEGRLHD